MFISLRGYLKLCTLSFSFLIYLNVGSSRALCDAFHRYNKGLLLAPIAVSVIYVFCETEMCLNGRHLGVLVCSTVPLSEGQTRHT